MALHIETSVIIVENESIPDSKPLAERFEKMSCVDRLYLLIVLCSDHR